MQYYIPQQSVLPFAADLFVTHPQKFLYLRHGFIYGFKEYQSPEGYIPQFMINGQLINFFHVQRMICDLNFKGAWIISVDPRLRSIDFKTGAVTRWRKPCEIGRKFWIDRNSMSGPLY